MKKGMRLLAVLSATVLLVSGCGTQMYELTEDEETLITQYAAYAIGKHNIRQKDGMTSRRKRIPQTKNKSRRKIRRGSRIRRQLQNPVENREVERIYRIIRKFLLRMRLDVIHLLRLPIRDIKFPMHTRKATIFP